MGVLSKRGHRLTVANNGHEAVEAYQRKSFDLILMDVQMPDMDGLEATRQIRLRERETGHHVPIVAMTAQAMKNDRERCLSAGMDEYLAKPVRANDLHQMVDSLCGTTTASSASDVPVNPLTPSRCNWERALAATGGDRELLADVIRAFLEECPLLMEQAFDAIEGSEALTLQRAAHTIKGAMRTFGSASAIELAGRLEEMGREDSLDEAEECFQMLKHEINSLIPEVYAYVSKSESH